MTELPGAPRRRATIAVDAMGGDGAPAVVVDGAVEAARTLDVAVVLVGPLERVRAELRRHPDVDRLPISVVDAPDAIEMGESPVAALRRKPRASIKVACECVARREADAVVSAGHTGASLVAAHATLGLIPGTERPALAVTLPTRTASAILLDAGANVDCRPEHLRQFGTMGAAYAQIALDLPAPRVGLLSIGEEPGKGTELVRQAHDALTKASLDFVGNVDARSLFSGVADVIVCDGFTGNVVLKVGEAAAELTAALVRAELGETADGAAAGALRRLAARTDDAERGAAPLLGIAGLVLVAHGRSSARAIRNAIATATKLVEERIVERLASALG